MSNKTKLSTTSLLKRISLLFAAALVAFMVPGATVRADRFDDQIRALEAEVNQYAAQADQLRLQADSLQNQINILQAEKNALQVQINANEAKKQQLTEQIYQTEQRIDAIKRNLGVTLKNIYIDSSITQLEMVASSRSISDYIDKQEYQNKIQQRAQSLLDEVRRLKEELTKQKAEVEKILADQQAQRDVLAAKESEQATLLAQTQGQEAAYSQLASQRNDRINQLREEQRRANARFIGGASYGGSGGYPWADAGGSGWSMYSCYGPDPWGMCLRQCVSYTAWKVYATGRDMPYWGGIGNANQWPGNARRAGIPVDSTPRAGDVAISMTASAWGHAMYVDSVNANGTINISQYNGNFDGRYSTSTISASGLQFIHF